MKKTTFLALILSLLVVSGCVSATSVRLLGSPNFIKENLPRLMAVEIEMQQLQGEIQMRDRFGLDISSFKKAAKESLDLYWVYYYAANTYLTSGDKDLYVQALAQAELHLAKMKEIFAEASESPKPETKPQEQEVEQLSL